MAKRTYLIPPCRLWIEQAIDEGATLYVERGRLRHHGDLPLLLLEDLYGYEAQIVELLLRPRWKPPAVAADSLRRMLADGLPAVDVPISTGITTIAPTSLPETIERLLRTPENLTSAHQLQVLHAVLGSWSGRSPSMWMG